MDRENELKKNIEDTMKQAVYCGVIQGYKAAYATIVEQIDMGMSLEEIKKWATNEKSKTEAVEKVTMKGVDNLDKND